MEGEKDFESGLGLGQPECQSPGPEARRPRLRELSSRDSEGLARARAGRFRPDSEPSGRLQRGSNLVTRRLLPGRLGLVTQSLTRPGRLETGLRQDSELSVTETPERTYLALRERERER